MSKYKFNTIKIPLTVKQKKARAEEYNEFDVLPGEEIDVKEFIKRDIYEEYIDLKCLNCQYEERAEADIILECFNPRLHDYPISYCPNCNKPKLVPKDIFNQIEYEKKEK